MYRINIKNFVYALLTADTASTITYGTPKAIPGLMNLDLQPEIASGKLYGDGALKDELSKLTSIGVKIDINKIPLTDRAIMLGQTCTAGVVDETGDEVVPFLAIGFMIEHADGTNEYAWLYKGRLKPISDKASQKTENISYDTQTMEFTFLKRTKDKKIRKWADSSEADFVAATGTGWFTAVPTT